LGEGAADLAAGGAYTGIIAATNGVNPTAFQTFTLTIDQKPTITSPDTATCVVGQRCSFTVATNGFPYPSLTPGPGFPIGNGLTFKDIGKGTATISGSPNPGTGGNYPFRINAKNVVATVVATASQSFQLLIAQAPVFTSLDAWTCVVGAECDFNFTATGSPLPYVCGPKFPFAGLSADAGLTITSQCDTTGMPTGMATLQGIPDAACTSCVIELNAVEVINGVPNLVATQVFNLTISAALAITSPDATSCIVDSPCGFEVTTTPFVSPTPSLCVPGPGFPSSDGLTFTDNGNGTATISGTPQATGQFGFSIHASPLTRNCPTQSQDVPQSFTLTVTPSLSQLSQCLQINPQWWGMQWVMGPQCANEFVSIVQGTLNSSIGTSVEGTLNSLCALATGKDYNFVCAIFFGDLAAMQEAVTGLNKGKGLTLNWSYVAMLVPGDQLWTYLNLQAEAGGHPSGDEWTDWVWVTRSG
jgi:hypothetical protein